MFLSYDRWHLGKFKIAFERESSQVECQLVTEFDIDSTSLPWDRKSALKAGREKRDSLFGKHREQCCFCGVDVAFYRRNHMCLHAYVKLQTESNRSFSLFIFLQSGRGLRKKVCAMGERHGRCTSLKKQYGTRYNNKRLIFNFPTGLTNMYYTLCQ